MEGCGVKCMKFLLFIFNFIIALCGLGLIVTGCLIHFGLANWIPIQEVAAVLQNDFLRSAVYMIIGAGALVFLIAICGCLGAILENRCLLVLYFLFLLIIFAAQLAAGILAAIYSNEITSFLDKEGKDFLGTNYGNMTSAASEADRLASNGWDVIQKGLECCGVTGSDDYKDNPNVKGQYPDSCCMELVENDEGNMICKPNSDPYPTGCKAQLEDLIVQYSTIIGASAVGVACFELFCMLFAICICRNIGDDD